MQIPLLSDLKRRRNNEREASTQRNTRETQIKLKFRVDGSGQTDIETGIGFFDHMLDGFARHGLFDLYVRVTGHLHVTSATPWRTLGLF